LLLRANDLLLRANDLGFHAENLRKEIPRNDELTSLHRAPCNQIRGFLLEHGIALRQGLRFLRQKLPDILAKRGDVLSPRMIRIMEEIRPDQERGDREIAGRGKKDEAPRRKRASQFVSRGRHVAYISVRIDGAGGAGWQLNGSASIARKWPRN
jgi:hypothetical protein